MFFSFFSSFSFHFFNIFNFLHIDLRQFSVVEVSLLHLQSVQGVLAIFLLLLQRICNLVCANRMRKKLGKKKRGKKKHKKRLVRLIIGSATTESKHFKKGEEEEQKEVSEANSGSATTESKHFKNSYQKYAQHN